ncbi:bifunctional non-homologous end joining protein LigD [Bradyrhizobium sp. Rc2d]|nr:bifunctional non-homologous end joining protein LigD [Bradyrhizobium sp. Rc2d]
MRPAAGGCLVLTLAKPSENEPILIMGDDLRSLHMRKANLEQLLARRPDGISVAPFERREIGLDLFRAACRMGLEGLVSKHRDRPYRGRRQKHWIKVKSRGHPAMAREL